MGSVGRGRGGGIGRNDIYCAQSKVIVMPLQPATVIK